MDERRATLIAALKNHEGWLALFEELAEQRDVYVRRIALQITTSKKPIDQREIDEERGFYRASRHIEELPERATRELQKIIERRVSGGEGGDEQS